LLGDDQRNTAQAAFRKLKTVGTVTCPKQTIE